MGSTRSKKEIPVVILCGGEGTRLREFTEVIPKPLVPIAGRPIVWHIMEHYSRYGFRRFILALGYKGESIKEYFMEWDWRSHDFTFNTKTGAKDLERIEPPDWNVTFVDTGLKTNTGGRVKKLERYLEGGRFMLTYGDGLSDVPVDRLMAFHRTHKRTATLTGVVPFSSFGQLHFTRQNIITQFREKPKLDARVNGGFFVFEPELLDQLTLDDTLEERPLRALAEQRQISMYPHDGFWRCVDTYKDWQALNAMADRGELAWLRAT